MVKNYVAETVLSPKHFGELHGKGATKITLDDLQSGGAMSMIHFNKLKDLNAYKKNLSLGKAYRLTSAKIKDIVDSTTGGSLLSGILKKAKSVGDKLGKPFEKTVQVNPFTAGYDLGHDVIAPALMKNGINFVPKNMRGGKVSTAKKVGKTLADGIKKVGKVLAKEVKTIAKNNKAEIGAIGKVVAKQALDSALGDGSKKDFSRALANASDDLLHVAARDVADRKGVIAKGDYKYGQYAPKSTAEAAEAAVDADGAGFVGSHVVKHGGRKGGAVKATQPSTQSYGLGGKRLANSFHTANDRMAYVRGFRGKSQTAGSFKPLGGSFAPIS